ncbi:MAG: ABC transporter permease [Gemmataceae bacterium]|nr:ABC transporter permease [Gemmataceae bacterium]MCS7269541.1 ABC transporter permease [Gemmataceae bacterium]MDW8243786.1 ABC transporter permease [Thermogemmata sp.]
MGAWLTEPSIVLAGIFLALVQLLAALPWLYVVDPQGFRRTVTTPSAMASVGLGLLAAGLALAVYMGYNSDSRSLSWNGRYIYGGLLHLQLLIDLFILLPYTVIGFRGGAVAYAAYREACRQPMFWLITLGAMLLTWLSVCIPYFTFGDDYKMMKQIGFDISMLAAILFGVLAASMSISEEIEGRTAVTLMSKPVNRRQFLLGKYAGIVLACLIMTLFLGWNLTYALRAVREFDQINNDPDPVDPYAPLSKVVDPMTFQAQRSVVPVFEGPVPSNPGKAVARGAGLWFSDVVAHTLGQMLGFGKVMILVAIAAALATRLSFVVNIVLCLLVYFLGHLAPVVVRVTETASGTAVGAGLAAFLGRLFDVLLPALEFFNMGPAIIREAPLDLWQFAIYVLTVFGYSCLYTAIALVVGLLLFEDRDLA